MEFFLKTFYDYLWNAENFNVQNLTKNLGEKQSCQNKALKTVAKNMNEKITQKMNELLKINDKTWKKSSLFKRFRF